MSHHPKKIEHMRERLKQGLTYRELGPEFGMSKSQAHRLVSEGVSEDVHPDDADIKKDLSVAKDVDDR